MDTYSHGPTYGYTVSHESAPTSSHGNYNNLHLSTSTQAVYVELRDGNNLIYMPLTDVEKSYIYQVNDTLYRPKDETVNKNLINLYKNKNKNQDSKSSVLHTALSYIQSYSGVVFKGAFKCLILASPYIISSGVYNLMWKLMYGLKSPRFIGLVPNNKHLFQLSNIETIDIENKTLTTVSGHKFTITEQFFNELKKCT